MIFSSHIESTRAVRTYQNQAHAVNCLSVFTARSPVQRRLAVDVRNSDVGISFRQQFDVVQVAVGSSPVQASALHENNEKLSRLDR